MTHIQGSATPSFAFSQLHSQTCNQNRADQKDGFSQLLLFRALGFLTSEVCGQGHHIMQGAGPSLAPASRIPRPRLVEISSSPPGRAVGAAAWLLHQTGIPSP